ncbi:MAG: DUF971 domain-containing protein [Pseudomonadota bacterium]
MTQADGQAGSPDKAKPWPLEIRHYTAEARLEIDFDTDETFSLSAEMLRVMSPSAEVKGHGPGQEITVAGKRSVTVEGIDPVGNYAVKLTFSDGHNTGFYTWRYLYELGVEKDAKWQAYLAELSAKGLGRD